MNPSSSVFLFAAVLKFHYVFVSFSQQKQFSPYWRDLDQHKASSLCTSSGQMAPFTSVVRVMRCLCRTTLHRLSRRLLQSMCYRSATLCSPSTIYVLFDLDCSREASPSQGKPPPVALHRMLPGGFRRSWLQRQWRSRRLAIFQCLQTATRLSARCPVSRAPTSLQGEADAATLPRPGLDVSATHVVHHRKD